MGDKQPTRRGHLSLVSDMPPEPLTAAEIYTRKLEVIIAADLVKKAATDPYAAADMVTMRQLGSLFGARITRQSDVFGPKQRP